MGEKRACMFTGRKTCSWHDIPSLKLIQELRKQLSVWITVATRWVTNTTTWIYSISIHFAKALRVEQFVIFHLLLKKKKKERKVMPNLSAQSHAGCSNRKCHMGRGGRADDWKDITNKKTVKDWLQEGGGKKTHSPFLLPGKNVWKPLHKCLLFSRAQVLHMPAVKSPYLMQFVAVWNISLFHQQFQRTMKASKIITVIIC